MTKTLDKVIREVLEAAGKPLSVRQITDSISKGKLWFRPKDGKLPDVTQVSARVNNYDRYFIRENGVVTLKKENSKVERLCKIVWNSNYWIKPMARSWNPAYIDDPNKGYEQKHGFVHEDWLFNLKFVFDGYQYGYIKGIGKLNPDIKMINTVYLFTINPNTKERFYIGKLYEVEHLQSSEIKKQVREAVKSYQEEMTEELRSNGADYAAFKKDPFVPNLRFKIESKEIFPIPLLIESNLFDKKYFRTAPIKMTEELYLLLHDLEKLTQFHFIPSTPERKSGGYTKHTKEGITTVDKIHDDIEKSLYNFLLQQGVAKENIACDTTSFGGKLADIVVQLEQHTYDIYEIKTDTDIRRGLREAVGQLLDYATWETSVTINCIYAVLPYTPISEKIGAFIKRMRANISLDFKICLYNKEERTFTIID